MQEVSSQFNSASDWRNWENASIMSNQEKRHRTSMQHLRYLDSFMDEIDREVMSLTDRAFKSLCIGDEAIYNDSEFSPSLVSCLKPMVEDVSKKAQQSSFSAAKKLNSYPLNGANDPLSRSNKSSKDSSLFVAFAAKKNGESSKMTNGDSWDKSALLSNPKGALRVFFRLSQFNSGTSFPSQKSSQIRWKRACQEIKQGCFESPGKIF